MLKERVFFVVILLGLFCFGSCQQNEDSVTEYVTEITEITLSTQEAVELTGFYTEVSLQNTSVTSRVPKDVEHVEDSIISYEIISGSDVASLVNGKLVPLKGGTVEVVAKSGLIESNHLLIAFNDVRLFDYPNASRTWLNNDYEDYYTFSANGTYYYDANGWGDNANGSWKTSVVTDSIILGLSPSSGISTDVELFITDHLQFGQNGNIYY